MLRKRRQLVLQAPAPTTATSKTIEASGISVMPNSVCQGWDCGAVPSADRRAREQSDRARSIARVEIVRCQFGDVMGIGVAKKESPKKDHLRVVRKSFQRDPTHGRLNDP